MSRWPKTSPLRPIRAGTPTTGRFWLWSQCCSPAGPIAGAASLPAPDPRGRGGRLGHARRRGLGLLSRRRLRGYRLGEPSRSGVRFGRGWQAHAGGSGLADVMMAPCADMFELGVRVQVLRRGTMYGVRASACTISIVLRQFGDAARGGSPAPGERNPGATCDEVWSEVRHFFEARDPT